MDEINKRDQNRITVLSAITDDTDKFITQLRVDPISKRLKVDQEVLTADTDTVKISDGTNDLYIWESGGITSVRAVHYRIKKSLEFYADYCWYDVANDADVFFHIKAGDKTPHGNITIYTSGKAHAFFYEAPTITNDGTVVASQSMNREVIGTPTASIYRDTVLSANGTEIECDVIGTAGKFTASGGDSSGAYWLFDHNKSYVVKVTNKSGDVSDIAISYGWHEHLAV